MVAITESWDSADYRRRGLHGSSLPVTVLELEMRKLLTLVAVVLALTMAIPSLAAASES